MMGYRAAEQSRKKYFAKYLLDRFVGVFLVEKTKPIRLTRPSLSLWLTERQPVLVCCGSRPDLTVAVGEAGQTSPGLEAYNYMSELLYLSTQ